MQKARTNLFQTVLTQMAQNRLQRFKFTTWLHTWHSSTQFTLDKLANFHLLFLDKLGHVMFVMHPQFWTDKCYPPASSYKRERVLLAQEHGHLRLHQDLSNLLSTSVPPNLIHSRNSFSECSWLL